MACLWRNLQNTTIKIPSTEDFSSITYYILSVQVGEVIWTVKHRYSEFFNLHRKLVTDHGISKDILPSKKVLGNKSDEFIESRRKALEEYLQRVFTFLKRTMPKVFVDFLDFQLYDTYFLLQDLSLRCSAEADFVMSCTKSFNLSPLELYSISELLKSPIPDDECLEKRLDLGPIMDICSQLNNLTVVGSSEQLLASNIVMNELPFELSSLKIESALHLKNVALEMLYSWGNLRDTLNLLKVSETSAKMISDILQCDMLHKTNLEGSQKWNALETLDLTGNKLEEIDKTICLAENLKVLILDNNNLTTVFDLTGLPKLERLSLVNNHVTTCDQLHTKIGNIKILNLSQNDIASVRGFSKLYSLEFLDLSCNKLAEIDGLSYLGKLPCLENVILTGNSVSTAVDYRVKVFELFGDRAKYICLDNEKASQAELDKASVLSALTIVKEGKTPDLEVDKSDSISNTIIE